MPLSANNLALPVRLATPYRRPRLYPALINAPDLTGQSGGVWVRTAIGFSGTLADSGYYQSATTIDAGRVVPALVQVAWTAVGRAFAPEFFNWHFTTIITPGAGYVAGVYDNVPLTGGTGSGATAKITVGRSSLSPVGTGVSAVNPRLYGNNYTTGDTLSASNANLGGSGAGFSCRLSTDKFAQSDIFDSIPAQFIDVHPEIATSQDGINFSAFSKWKPGIYIARKFRMRWWMQSFDADTLAYLSSASWAVYLPTRTDNFPNTPIAGGGSTLIFRPDGQPNAAFNGGLNGANVPTVNVTILNAAAGDNVVMTGLSLSQVTIQVFNTGVGVARNCTIQAIGF